MMKRFYSVILSFSLFSILSAAESAEHGAANFGRGQRAADRNSESYKDLSRHPFVVANMIYATRNNFVGENIYGNFKKPLAHFITDEKLQKANEELQRLKPGWKFKVYDALRPHDCQIKLWNKVKGTPHQGYVMNPQHGSIHSFGFALDITLEDENGNEVDMGTPVDSFKDLSHPKYEQRHLASGELTRAQYDNRQILRKSMVKGGFQTISNEWWHFEALPSDQVRGHYPLYNR